MRGSKAKQIRRIANQTAIRLGFNERTREWLPNYTRRRSPLHPRRIYRALKRQETRS